MSRTKPAPESFTAKDSFYYPFEGYAEDAEEGEQLYR
jgi:hypothetical protein